MAGYPKQTFTTLQQLKDYTNNTIVKNGSKDIDAIEANNVFNGAIDFIPKYTVNAENGADIISGGGAVELTKPVSVIATTVPTSVVFYPNIQKEYYITNTLDEELTLGDGITYYDTLMVQKTTLPKLTNIHLALAQNGAWIQINNLAGTAGDVPNSKEDTPAITINLSGTLNRTIEAEFNVSEEEGNAIEIKDDGAFVPTPPPASSSVRGDS